MGNDNLPASSTCVSTATNCSDRLHSMLLMKTEALASAIFRNHTKSSALLCCSEISMMEVSWVNAGISPLKQPMQIYLQVPCLWTLCGPLQVLQACKHCYQLPPSGQGTSFSTTMTLCPRSQSKSVRSNGPSHSKIQPCY